MEQATPGDLTPRQREMLEFERVWWQFDEPREDLIKARFACTADEYYAELNQVLELPGAMAHDPLVVRRFRRRRLRRRRSLFEANSPAHATSIDPARHIDDGAAVAPDDQPDEQQPNIQQPNIQQPTTQQHGGAHA